MHIGGLVLKEYNSNTMPTHFISYFFINHFIIISAVVYITYACNKIRY